MKELAIGILTPFLGTALGAMGVFFLRRRLSGRAERPMNGFAAGVMTAAAVWSLLIPAIERSEGYGMPVWLPAVIGTCAGVLFLTLIDRFLPVTGEGRRSMLLLAVTIHNLPEGMAVGAAYAGALYGEQAVSASAAFALALGIAIQNLPEGAIVSMPEAERGKGRAFLRGVLSGAIEPAGAILTLLAAERIVRALPFFLSFAAGTMLYVVVEELLPEEAVPGVQASPGRTKKPGTGTAFFFLGFLMMMVLDVALG